MAKKCMSCGGAMKKMQKGGSNVKTGIYGIPQENIGTSSQFQPTAKKGGAVKKMAKGGIAKAQYGASTSKDKGTYDSNSGIIVPKTIGQAKRGGATKMKTGGSAKSFPDLNKDGKISKADILKGRGVIKKKGGPVKKK
jgi:hypothetical protein